MTVTGELKSKIDSVWDAFWSGGISNPLEVMEQITYLLFIKGLDETHTREENKASTLGQAVERPIFPDGDAPTGRPYADLRWSRFKDFEARDMYDAVDNHVFPFLQARAEESSHAKHMEDARLSIPTPGLLQKVVDGLDAIEMENRDTKGDIYEYMLGKIATAGQNGQFRTPRHIIRWMVDAMAPQPKDTICDPASGTCGFLVAAGEYIRAHHPEALTDEKLRDHFHNGLFSGFDFDNTMLRIGSMNMQLHGVDNPTIEYRDSLAEEAKKDEEAFNLILANPPFAGSLDYDGTAKDLLATAKTKKTELLFLALFLRLLKTGGRAAVIVPDGVLFGSTKAHKTLRKLLVEEHKLDGVVSLPSGVFKPYAGVSTAILLFTKTGIGGTEHVWFYDLEADGFSLDDKRNPVEADDLPDALVRWTDRDGAERDRARTEKSFCVPKEEIAENDYDLSLNRYKEIVFEEIDYPEPAEIIAELEDLEAEITQGLSDLKAMLK